MRSQICVHRPFVPVNPQGEKDSRKESGRKAGARFALALCAFFLAVFTFIPTQVAHADKSYEVTKVDIDATVNEYGDLDVVETRTYYFSGYFTAVWWDLDPLPRPDQRYEFVGAAASASAIQSSLPYLENDLVDLSEVPFNTSWRDVGSPEQTAYSVDSPEDSIWLFFPDRIGSTQQFRIHYRIYNAATTYRDTSELLFDFVGDKWTVDSQNVNLTVHFPHGDPQPRVGENFFAWGRGAVAGDIALHPEDYAVTVHLPQVRAGVKAAIRIAFPRQWLFPVATIDDDALESIKREEIARAGVENIAWIYEKVGIFLIPLPAIAALVLGWRITHGLGSTVTPHFQGKYWRDVPPVNLEEYGIPYDLHPAVVGANDNGGEVGTPELNASLMHLVHRDVLRIYPLSPGNFQFTSTVERLRSLRDPIDMRVAEMLFDVTISELEAPDSDVVTVTTEDFESRSREEFTRVHSAYKGWEDAVKRTLWQYQLIGYLSEFSRIISFTMVCVAFLVAVVGTFRLVFDDMVRGLSGSYTQSKVGLGIAFVAYLVAGAGLISMLKDDYGIEFRQHLVHTQAGAELHAHSQALRQWLRDFTGLTDAPPTDEVIWGYFLTYATLYGISDKVIDNLRITLPSVANSAIVAPSVRTASDYWINSENSRSPLESITSGAHAAENEYRKSKWERAGASGSGTGSSGGGFSYGGDFYGGSSSGVGGGGGGAR